MKHLLVVATVIVFAGCCSMNHMTSDVQSGDADNAIRQMDRDFSAAASSGNLDGMMSIYTDDATLMAAELPPFQGKAAIRQFWTGFMSAYPKVALTLTPDEITQSGDMATEVGHYEADLTAAGSTTPFHDKGKFFLAWRKVNGKWLAYVDSFSSNSPPPAR